MNRFEFEIVEHHIKAAEAKTREAMEAIPYLHPKSETLMECIHTLELAREWLRDEMEEEEGGY